MGLETAVVLVQESERQTRNKKRSKLWQCDLVCLAEILTIFQKLLRFKKPYDKSRGMKKVGVLLIMIFSLVVSTAMAADMCQFVPASSIHAVEVKAAPHKDGKTQPDKMVDCGHYSCQHHVASRLPSSNETRFPKQADKLFVAIDRVVASHNSPPPLKPPMHV